MPNREMPTTAEPQAPRLLLHGLDSLYVSCFSGLSAGVLDFGAISEAKAAAGASRSRMAEVVLGGERFAVMPHGKKPYSYVLHAEAGAFEMRLAERMQPSCHVQFASEALWRTGAPALMRRVETWLSGLGAAALRPERIARADFAFDYHLPGGADFIADHLLSRATKDATHRQAGRVQTITAGRGDVVLRLYDKVAEIEQQSSKAFFFDLWGERADVWRIEVQLRGERLPAGGIRSFGDLVEFGPDLLREIVEAHTTLRVPTSDSNRARWPLHPLWRALQADVARLPQSGLVRDLGGREPGHDYRLWQQLRSLMGSLKGIACTLGEKHAPEPPPGLPELLVQLRPMLEAGGHHHPAYWTEDVRRSLQRRGFGL